ncbi:MAG TPA: cache domain-containing protein [Dissulfurispiraceae bacterium]|nr:cache domain-containing protein [Dissulfurispiraceae bacterium]
MKINLGGIKTGIAIPLLATLIIGLSILCIFNYFSQVSLMNDEAEEAMTNTINATQTVIDAHLSLYQQMSALIAGMPTVAETMSKGDRPKLSSEFFQSFDFLRNQANLNQFNFIKPDGIVLLRLQDPNRYGDNLSDIRKTISDVIEKKKGVRGIEFGRTGLGLRGIEPVFLKGVFVGSAEFGGDMIPAFNEVKNAFGTEIGLLVVQQATAQVSKEWQRQGRPVGGYMPFYSTRPELSQAVLNDALLSKAKNAGKGVYMDLTRSGGREYSIALSSLKDYSGKEIGFLYVLKDRTAIVGKIRKSLVINVAIYLLMLVLVSVVIGYTITKNVINPVISLTSAADDISMGKLADKVEIKGAKNEIAVLAKSIDRMRVSMKKLLME